MRRVVVLLLAAAAAMAAEEDAKPGGDQTPDPALERRVSLAASDELLPKVLEDLGAQAGVVIRARPYLTETRVTLRVRDVPIRDALDALCGVHHWSYRKSGEAYVISAVCPVPRERGLSLRATLLQSAPEPLRALLTRPDICELMHSIYNQDLQDSVELDAGERYQRGEDIPYAELSPEVRELYLRTCVWEAVMRLARQVQKPQRHLELHLEDCRLVFTKKRGWFDGSDRRGFLIKAPDGTFMGWGYPYLKRDQRR